MIFAVYVIFFGQNCGITQRKFVKKQHFEGKSEVKRVFLGDKERNWGKRKNARSNRGNPSNRQPQSASRVSSINQPPVTAVTSVTPRVFFF